MACKYLNPHTGKELMFSKNLREYYKLDDSQESSNFLDTKVEMFYSQGFKDIFGDWVSEQYPEDYRIDSEGAPKLFKDNENFYVLDKNNEKYFINNRRFEGLEFYPGMYSKLNTLKQEASSLITKYIFDKYKNNNDDITDLDDVNFNLNSEVESFFQSQIEQNPEGKDHFDILLQFKDDFVLEVKDFLKNINLSYNEIQDLDDASYQDNLEESGAVVGQSSIEKNNKDNATGNIKLMLSLLSDVESESDFFIGNKLLPFSKIWNETQSLLSNIPKIITIDNKVINPLDVMVERLNKLAKHKKYYQELLNTIENSSDNLKAQFVSAFANNGKYVQDTLEVDKNGYKYSLVNAAESSSKKSKILVDAGLSFKSNFTEKIEKFDSITNKKTVIEEFDIVAYNIFRNDYFKFRNLYMELKSINLKENLNKEASLRKELLVETLPNQFKKLIIKLGFNFSDEANNYFLTNQGLYSEISSKSIDEQLNKFVFGFNMIDKTLISNKFTDINEQKKSASNILFDKENRYLNIFKGEANQITAQSIISEIAESISFFNTDMSEDMFFAGDKQMWVYSQVSHLFDTVNILNNSKDEVNKRLKQTFTKNSQYLQLYKNAKEGKEVIKIHRTSSMMEKGNASESKSVNGIAKTDSVNKNLFEALLGKKSSANSLFPTTLAAGKSTELKLETSLFVNTTPHISENNEIVLSDEVIDIFTGYFEDEILTALEAKKFIHDNIDDNGNVDVSKLTQYRHIDGNGNTFDILNASGESIFETKEYKDLKVRNNIAEINKIIHNNPNSGFVMVYTGGVFKNYMTPSLSPENLINKLEIFKYFYQSDFTPVYINELTTAQKEILKVLIGKSLSNQIKDDITYFKNNNVFDSVGVNKTFDNTLYDLYKKDNDNDIKNTFINIISDYTVNSTIAQIEYSKLFNGSVNSHKNMMDYFKRGAKGYIDGKGLHLGITENDHQFNITVLQDMETSSPYLENMGAVGKKFYSGTKINQADAQAYITPERWKFLLERLGQFGNNEKKIYDKILKMEAGENISFTSKELKKLSTKPLKGVYYSNIDNNPVYLKYSQTVLLKSLVKGSPLEALLNQMRTQNISEAIMNSGVKVGARLTENDTSQDILDGNLKTLNTIPLDNRFWKLQQDLPNKGFKETLLGSQIQKNIFDNFNFENIYSFGDKTFTGEEVYNNIHDAIGELSSRGVAKIIEKFGITSDFKITNWSNFAKDIAEQLRQEKVSENIVKAVEKELTPYVIPQSKDKVLSTIMSIINKATVKLKTNGGSLIQMSNFGLDQNLAENTGIRWIKDKQQLAEPLKFLREDGSAYVKPGQCFISGNILGQYVPNWREYPNEELFGKDGNGGMFPKEILQMVGYRIPNQALSSNDALEIVGVLPDTYIDTIVPYTGITTKTGSDFDVDKMFMILPSVKSVENGVEYVNYDNSKNLNEQSTEAVNNRLFEMYHAILTQSENYDNLITPIDHTYVKDFIKDELFPTTNKLKDYQPFSATHQIDMRYEFIAGEFGIGQVANQLVDSVMNQVAQEELNNYIGWGNYRMIETGKGKSKKVTVFDMKSEKGIYDETGTYKISDILTALLNAFVDIAKDSYITRGNWNTQTTNTGCMLIRAGVNPMRVLSFLAQPSLIEMVQITAEREGIISKEGNSSKVTEELQDKYLNLLKESLNYSKENWNLLKNDISSKKLITDINLNGTITSNKISERSLDVLKNNAQKVTEDSQYYLDQYLALKEYENLKPLVKEFTKSVSSSKYGETGVSKSLVEFINQSNKTADVHNSDVIKNFSKKFYNGDKLTNGYTSLGHYHKNTEVFFNNLVNNNPKIFITANDYFKNIMNDMVSETHKNKKYSDDIDTGKILEQSFYTMISSESSLFKMGDEKIKVGSRNINKEFLYLFTNAKDLVGVTLSELIETTKQQLREVSTPNFFLENLEIKEDDGFTFIGIDGIKIKPNDFTEMIIDGWRNLEKDYPSLSEDLVKYAYQQSGFKYNANQIYQYIPHEVFVKNNFNNYISKLADSIDNGEIDSEILQDNIYRHNWKNSKIVPIINVKNHSKTYPDNSGFKLKYDSERHSGEGLINGKKILTYPKFVNYNDGLYKLEGYLPTVIKNVKDLQYEPIYFKTHKLGYKSEKGQLHEYTLTDELKESSIKTNNVTQIEKEAIDSIMSNEGWNNVIPYNDVEIKRFYYGSVRSFVPNVLNSEDNIVSLDDEVEIDNIVQDEIFTEEDLGLDSSSTQEDAKC